MAGPSRAYPFYQLAWNALDWLFPPQCVGCGRPGTRWCPECQRQVPVIRENVCAKCGRPREAAGDCPSCRSQPPPYQALRSWAAYADPVRKALRRLKYRRDVALGDSLAAQMALPLQSLNWPIEVIIPVPLSIQRRRQRGYNQAGLIARPLAMALGLRYLPESLARWRDTRSQVGLTGEQRRHNVHGVFRADEAHVRGRRVLLIDDIATTGSTLSSASEALLAGGASQVYAFTAARAGISSRTDPGRAVDDS